MYEEAKRYYEHNGNLEIPYIIKRRRLLAQALIPDASGRAGRTIGELTEEHIVLDAIGMIWELRIFMGAQLRGSKSVLRSLR